MFVLICQCDSRSYSRPDRRSAEKDEFSDEACSSPPSLQMVKFLDSICEDCYLLYRDIDIYQMCRSECYGTEFFLGCMESIMVSKPTRNKAAHFLNLINNFAS